MRKPRILISESAGYCWGVERGLRLAREAAEDAAAPVRTLGPLIHNPQVIRNLETQGIQVLKELTDDLQGTLIIRSHGVPRETMDRIQSLDVGVVDATCTFVKAAQEKASRLRDRGYLVVVLGEPNHPEVLGIRSYAGSSALVVSGPEDLPERLPKKRIGVVVQTTQSEERLAALVSNLAPRIRELLVYNTICSATEERQEAAVRMARQADLVLVVGGKNSGNTTRLAELCSQVQPHTHHIEGPDEIEPSWFEGVRRVGVTAGASTPPEQIQTVVGRVEELYE